MASSHTASLPRITREKRTIHAMLQIHCRAWHGTSKLCAECQELLSYAHCRLDRCPYGEEKPTCVNCPIHCYKPAMRDRIRDVMRYAGPRLVYKHPVLAIRHVLDGRRSALRALS